MTDPQVALLMLGSFIFLIMLGFPIAFTLMGMAVGVGYYAYFDWNRLSVRMEIDPATLDAQVPSLILPPWVENAIRHGIEPQMRAGVITIRSARERDDLVLSVIDNGVGMPPNGFKREGIGIANSRARLSELYGERQKFELGNQPEGGLCVRVTIPFAT